MWINRGNFSKFTWVVDLNMCDIVEFLETSKFIYKGNVISCKSELLLFIYWSLVAIIPISQKFNNVFLGSKKYILSIWMVHRKVYYCVPFDIYATEVRTVKFSDWLLNIPFNLLCGWLLHFNFNGKINKNLYNDLTFHRNAHQPTFIFIELGYKKQATINLQNV